MFNRVTIPLMYTPVELVSYAKETVDINLGDYNFKEFLFAVYFY